MEDDDDSAGARADELIYAFKPSMSQVHAFKLTASGLDWEQGRYSGHIPYRTIRRVRLSFRPMSLATHRFTAEIWSEGAPKLTVASTSWRSVVEWQRLDSEYTAFVRALMQRIAAAGGAPRLDSGANPLLFWPGLVIAVPLLGALAWMALRALFTGARAEAAVVGALLVIFGWQVANFFWRNWPRRLRPDAIPSAVLPRGG